MAGNFLGIEWHVWKVIGWCGNIVFASRFLVQWIATEKKKRVVIPVSFWWISLLGSSLLMSYAIYRKDSVFIFAYLPTFIPYIRNIVIHYRNKARERHCSACSSTAPARAKFCLECGLKLDALPTEELSPR
jgi:lipid-A-disaccharide synthase-like uncharacterized protein